MKLLTINNCFLLLNKPKNISSFKLILNLRKILKTRKIGHIGTLDPMATGLMIVGVGKEALKAIRFCNVQEKEYEVVLELGFKTNSKDITGAIIETKKVNFPTEKEIKTTFSKFVGSQTQIPPLFSAKKVNGVRLYKYARKGIKINVKPIQIFIKKLDLLNFNPETNKIKFKVLVSSGTYIRTLCEDIAKDLKNNLAVMAKLTRTKIGPYNIEQSSETTAIKKCSLIPISEIISYPEIKIAENNLLKIMNGQSYESDKFLKLKKGFYKILKNDTILAIVKIYDSKIRTIRKFNL